MAHITSGGSYYGAGGSAGGSAPQRRTPRVHRIHRIHLYIYTSYTSYNIRRPFLPSVHIDGGGGARLFFYFTNMMFERFTITCIKPHPGLVFQYIPNLSNFLFQGGSAGGSAPPRRVPLVHCIHRITSSVHSYLRSISTAGAAVSFFTLQFTCSRDLPIILLPG